MRQKNEPTVRQYYLKNFFMLNLLSTLDSCSSYKGILRINNFLHGPKRRSKASTSKTIDICLNTERLNISLNYSNWKTTFEYELTSHYQITRNQVSKICNQTSPFINLPLPQNTKWYSAHSFALFLTKTVNEWAAHASEISHRN